MVYLFSGIWATCKISSLVIFHIPKQMCQIDKNSPGKWLGSKFFLKWSLARQLIGITLLKKQWMKIQSYAIGINKRGVFDFFVSLT